MAINYTNKVNELSVGQTITSEPHQVGILATATYSSGNIRLIQVPQGPGPAVVIPGYTEILTGVPTTSEFIVNYITGVITFNSSQNGASVAASYTGLGSEIAAEDVNELQNPVSAIVTQTLTYISPFTSATATWALANGIVKPSSISTSGSDNFVFPNNVTISGLSTGIVHSSSFGSLSSSLIVNADVNASAGIAVTKLAPLSGAANSIVTINGSGFIQASGASVSNIFLADGSVTATGNFNLGGFRITNLGTPTVSTDAATKGYIDTNFLMLTGGVLTGAVSGSELYAGAPSHQGISFNESLSVGAGSSTSGSPARLGATLFTVTGASLTSTANYIGGVIGAYNVTGTKATTYPTGAILGQIADNVVNVDGAVVAYIDGAALATPTAAFKAMNNNSFAGSGFFYGLDLYGASHDGLPTLAILNADIRLSNQVCILNGTGAPVNGTTGLSFAASGSLYIDNASGNVYANTGTIGAPSWTQFAAGSGATTALSNLSSVAINTSLLPAVDAAINLGSSSFRWANLSLAGTALIGGTSIDPSAILELDSIAQGFLLPRMTISQRNAIGSPATGLQIFNTNSGQIEFYNGTTWGAISGASAGGMSGAVQYNNSGTLAGDTANFFWKDSTTQLGIGTNAPNASALVDLTSTTTGFLPPRMTTTQRTSIASPAEGLEVYDLTSHQWYGWNGTSWVILG